MNHSTAPRPLAPTPSRAVTGITVYGCDEDEATLFGELAPQFGAIATLTDAPPSAATVALAAGNRCVSVNHKTPIANETLLALSRAGVMYLSTRSVGIDHIDVGYAVAVGLRVATVAYSPDAIADFTLMAMLMIVRGARSMVRRTDAHDYRPAGVRGAELRDLTVGVVGTGRIGAAVIDRLRGFGCRILAHDIRPSGSVRYVPLTDLLRESDIVTLHAPLTTRTRHLLDATRIAQIKHGAVVVNTARGGLIDTDALASALEHGRLGGAALDVIQGEEEVFYTDRPGALGGCDALRRLHELPNVLISPHTAYYTGHALRDIVENTLVNCLTYDSEARRHG
ncbi:MAG: D-lactate dehydrogenase VanH-A [Bifidobacteriaceae bacterium]|jgi:D-specific alpha-keto acid dehydrogenase|nr:D-lactate dehydrogenase VanH-A [Bifidobacteriaceae bacterium]